MHWTHQDARGYRALEGVTPCDHLPARASDVGGHRPLRRAGRQAPERMDAGHARGTTVRHRAGRAGMCSDQPGDEMKTKVVLALALCVLASPLWATAQTDKLGKVTFPTSCDARVQAQFDRGLAMLHS